MRLHFCLYIIIVQELDRLIQQPVWCLRPGLARSGDVQHMKGRYNMSKKKNKVQSWLDRFDDDDKKKNKKKKKNKNRDDRQMNINGPKLKNVKPTLDRKDVREVHKAADKPIKLPKVIEEKREVCNHVQDVMSVAKFRNEFEDRQYLASNLDSYVKIFGENYVGICNGCFEVLLDRRLITIAETQRAFLLIIGAMNHLMANYRMGKKELKNMKSSQEMVNDVMKTVLPMLKELREAEGESTETAKVSYGGATPVGNEASTAETAPTNDERRGLEIPEGMNL